MLDMIVIGAGIAGLTCTLYARRADLAVMVIEQQFYGGQILTSPDVENYPGFIHVSGFDLMQTVYQQSITNFNTPIIYETIEQVFLTDSCKRIITNKNTYEAKTIVIATGAKYRKLHCPGEDEWTGKGVSYCATCDGAFFKNKAVAVVGGGNTALQDALYLANLCETVFLIHRRDTFRGDSILVNKVLATNNIKPIYDTICKEIIGEKQVTGMIVSHVHHCAEQHLAIDGVFVAVGVDPANEIFRDSLQLDSAGYIVAGEDCKTTVPGVFVAGDTRRKQVRQLVTAAADGAVSSQMATEYIQLL